ncbi:MAG: hypothetical protein H6669_09315 [Ardenticatenaceae bacterium]|nr:hypothetical protein [Ardenticatenaceae bacterium]
MTQETTQKGRTFMAVVIGLAGLFLLFLAPFIAVKALNTPLHRLVEVFQVQDPEGVWDTPVGILTSTYYVWIGLFVFAGAALVMIANDVRVNKPWARPLALMLLSIPSIGGLTMTIPWMVLVMTDALGNNNPAAGAPPAIPIMAVGLVAYFIVLLTEKSARSTKIAQVVVFAMLGLVGGFVWMNAQHGVRYFISAPVYLRAEAGGSNPELFYGGFVNYAAVMLFVPAIGLLAARKESGWYLAMIGAILTFAAAFLSYIDRMGVNPAAAIEWLRGALLSAVLLVILVIPFFKNHVLGTVKSTGTKSKMAKPAKAHA